MPSALVWTGAWVEKKPQSKAASHQRARTLAAGRWPNFKGLVISFLETFGQKTVSFNDDVWRDAGNYWVTESFTFECRIWRWTPDDLVGHNALTLDFGTHAFWIRSATHGQCNLVRCNASDGQWCFAMAATPEGPSFFRKHLDRTFPRGGVQTLTPLVLLFPGSTEGPVSGCSWGR